MDGEDLHACAGFGCDRSVSPPSLYCCVPCAEADARSYEIRAHSPGCDERAARRGAPAEYR